MLTFRYNRQTKGMEYMIADANGPVTTIITDWTPIHWTDCAQQASHFAWRLMGQPGDSLEDQQAYRDDAERRFIERTIAETWR